ncbi:uncharacterized protein LOC107605853 [Arachis ipaensis]|uniref:uncharacterized protein LOC107605853 n=1 Tax=Arachis ipaensis TaxID=130454 RepID=UPI0007AF3B59|nr:uncharacterized protein LOC107605853 [Arachis ipaensis]XP_025666763.1 uncharacterized protein LOC112765111 [Arachis hypogaea]
MATARCSPPRRRRGALLHGDGAVRSSLCAERPPARNPFSLLFSFFLFFSFPASSSLRTGDASKIVATSVPLASFDATRQPPLNSWKFWSLEHMACLNFDYECFYGVLKLLRYSNIFEIKIASEEFEEHWWTF